MSSGQVMGSGEDKEVSSVAMGRSKHVLFYSVIIAVILACSLLGTELALRFKGFGNPPLYQADAVSGYALSPSQNLTRLNGCRVLINGLGMRSAETTKHKPQGAFRVLVLGDSVPYGGSYIDQSDLFCSIAEAELNHGTKRFEVLNGGVNGFGPRNVAGVIQKHGLYDANLTIIYLPWTDLHRPFTHFTVMPFWSESPTWALAEFFRHGVWRVFGRLNGRWKSKGPSSEELLELNIEACHDMMRHCQRSGVPLYFFWSPSIDSLRGKPSEKEKAVRESFRRAFPQSCIVDVEPVLLQGANPDAFFVDGGHYSAEGHRIIGNFLAQFIASFVQGHHSPLR